MPESESIGNRVFNSAKKALSPLNLLFKFSLFIIFSVLTAFPYLIKNIDGVWSKVIASGISSTGAIILMYLKALWGTMWQGVFIGLSTAWDSFLNFSTYSQQGLYGTLGYSIMVAIFATVAVYQPVSVLFDILDKTEGKNYSVGLAFFVSAMIVILGSPIAHYSLEGQTLTSGLVQDAPTVDEIVNETVAEIPNDIPTLDLTGGNNNETNG